MSVYGKEYDLTSQSAKSLAKKIKDKTISAVELSTAYIQQIEKVNPLINAVAQVDSERILKEAKKLDAELAKGILRGPFHGVPITVKDNLMTQDIVSTGGSFAYLDFMPAQDATVVKRMRDAGAIILGKSNLPDFALAWETTSTAYGRTNNPYHLGCTAGGSSGGEAAIVAASGSALGIGTDSGGSIRLPAHYCGIAGLKTSRGLIPTTGHIPPKEGYPILGVFAQFNAIGPMARFVEDLLYSLPILTGRDGVDPYAEIAPVNPISTFSLKGLRVAMYPLDDLMHPDIAQSVYQSAKILEEQGAIIHEAEPPDVDSARSIYSAIVGADGGEGVRSLLTALAYEGIPPGIAKSLDLMEKEPTLRKFLDVSIQWDVFRIKMLDFMQAYDVILSPVAAFTALEHGTSFTDVAQFNLEKYLIPYNLMGWPAVVVRAGTSANGLPIGVQLVGMHGQDYQILHVACALEEQLGGWQAEGLFF